MGAISLHAAIPDSNDTKNTVNPFNTSCSKLLLFEAFGSGAQDWAPERPNVKN